MHASDLRSGFDWTTDSTPSRIQPQWFIRIGVFVSLVLLLILGWTLTRPQDEPHVEVPVDIPYEIVGPNKVLLPDYPDRPWLSYYKAHNDMLGDPIWSERPYDVHANCVGFTRFIVCLNLDPQAKDTQWRFLPLLLGEHHVPEGVTPQLNAPLAPIVQAYIEKLAAEGLDWIYWLGAPISPAYSPNGSGMEFQIFQRQVLVWPKGSQDPADIRLSPLGVEETK